MCSRLIFPIRHFSLSLPAFFSARNATVKGKFRTWTKPVYVSPEPKMFALEPDFSFLDGRPCPITSQFQLDWKKDQLRLAKAVVKSLAEVQKIEKVHERAEREEELLRLQRDRSRPIPKGKATIK